MRACLDLHLGHDGVLDDAGDDAGKAIACRAAHDGRGLCRDRGGGLAQDPGDLRALHHLAPRGVAGRCDSARLDPAPEGVVAHPEVGGRFRYPQLRHSKAEYTAFAGIQPDVRP